MPNFTIAPLLPARIDEAYALVRMARPDLTAFGWKAEAQASLAAGGILALEAPSGVIQALASWEDRPDCAALKVDTFVAFELSRKAPARQALCEALQVLARDRGKAAVQFPLGSLGFLGKAPAEAA